MLPRLPAATLLAVGIFLTMTGLGVAQDSDRVRGQVLSPAGAPLPGVHVMLLEGRKVAPPFLVRPRVFFPLPSVQVVTTDDDGRFEFKGTREGVKTLLVGEEGPLLFGTAASRTAERGSVVTVTLSEAEAESLATIGDRAERASAVVEDVLINADLALGWLVDAQQRIETAIADLEERVGALEHPAAAVPEEGAEERALSRLERLRDRVRSWLP